MNDKTSRMLWPIVFVTVGSIVYPADAAPAPATERTAAAKTCDALPTWQRPSKTPKAVNMALMGLGLVAVGAVTRRRAIKRS